MIRIRNNADKAQCYLPGSGVSLDNVHLQQLQMPKSFFMKHFILNAGAQRPGEIPERPPEIPTGPTPDTPPLPVVPETLPPEKPEERPSREVEPPEE